MTVTTVKSVATRFLTTENPEVLALKGAWGVGKTYFWNQIVQELKSLIKLPSYCYVSLFGIASLSELRLAIFAKTQPVKRIGEKLDAETINKEWASLGWGAFRSFTHGLVNIKDAPYLKNLFIGLDTIAPHLIKNTIICLDDFERLSDRIQPDELLGFVSALKEEKGCKIVLIFNEEQLSDKKEVYNKYREKVVDIELLFSPTAEEAVELAFPTNLPLRDLVRRCATSLGIRNIRILRKIASLTDLIHKEVRDFHQGVMEQAVTTLVLVAWSYYDKNDRKPTIQFIRDWNRMLWDFNVKEKKEEDPHRLEWAGVLRDYGLLHMDEFDLAISKVIEHGYIEETGLLEEATKLDAQFHANELENSFTEAWKLFHNTFTDNKAELIQALTNSFRKSVRHISPLNLNGTVKLLRELERNDLADELIEYYVQVRGGEEQLFDLEAYPFAGDINDAVVRKRFDQKHAAVQQLPNLVDAVKGMAQKSGWSKAEIQVLEYATENDFYNLFKLEHGDELSRVVKTCLQFEGFAGHQAIGQKARAALERVGQECQLNAIRVKRYGISVGAIGKPDGKS